MPLAVNEQSDEIAGLAKQWAVLEPLMAGTPAMREGGAKFLPRWPNEEDASYAARLATATLMPAYRRTVGVMAGKPFAKALTLSDDTPATLQQWAEDIDLQGVSLHSFASEMFAETVGYGLAGVLVDYPDATIRDDKGKPVKRQARTVAQVEAAGLRPYFVRIKHGQILGWKAALQAGRMRLTQLRLMESADEDDGGPFGIVSIQQVRVLYPGRWEVYRKAVTGPQKGKWTLHTEGVTTLPVIPFVPFYGSRDAYMCGRAPLLDLAYLNVKHWQSQSDQDTILHVARVPILAVIGVEDEAWQLTVGASTAVKLPINADMKFVEHSGASISAGAESLAALEDQMIQTGAELMVKKPGDRSATEAGNDAEGNKSDLQRMAETFEDSLDQAMWLMAQYARLPKSGSVSLFSDYGASTLSDASATLIKDLQMGGLISKATAINELKRRAVLGDTVDADEEAELVAADGPALGTLGDGVDPGAVE